MKRVCLFVCLAVFTIFGLVFDCCIAAELTPAPEGSFSFVVLPDTQGYVTEKSKDVFEAEIDWILENRDSQNIVFVSHVGDIVNKYKAKAEWKVAKQNMLRLLGKVPFGFSVGNHDMLSGGESKNFQDTFPAKLFNDCDWYGGQIKNNANSFQLISAGGIEFVILHLECNAPDDVLDWASEVLEAHSNRAAMITTHMYLGPLEKPNKPNEFYDAPKGRMRWLKRHGKKGNTPQQMWEKCFSKHKNLFLICCGDQSRTQAMHQTVQGVNENSVHECVSDYREGYLRILRFEPNENRIAVMTYSPYLRKLCEGTKIVPDIERHQFELAFQAGN